MIYNVEPEIEDYFIEQYQKSDIQVASGHWPKMKTKEDVDKWIKFLDIISKLHDDVFDEQTCRICGCTWDNGCPDGCWWVEEDLCSSCVEGRKKNEKSDPSRG